LVIVAEPKQVVAPGEVLAEGSDHTLGDNVYRIGSKIYSACVGIFEEDANRILVVPLKGGYIPHQGDLVAGRIVDVGLSGWTVDIRAPYEAMLPASETGGPRGPRRRDLSITYDVGDMVIGEVLAFDRTRDPLLTTKGPGLGKVTNGRVVEISAAKIPRLIGRKGSMIAMLKTMTNCQITVGQNGVVLVWGKTPENERLAVEAIYMIEREAHTRGLTDRIRDMINKSSPSSSPTNVMRSNMETDARTQTA
jgi:exosome complex component RRP4